jgi:hypothetical protein
MTIFFHFCSMIRIQHMQFIISCTFIIMMYIHQHLKRVSSCKRSSMSRTHGVAHESPKRHTTVPPDNYDNGD